MTDRQACGNVKNEWRRRDEFWQFQLSQQTRELACKRRVYPCCCLPRSNRFSTYGGVSSMTSDLPFLGLNLSPLLVGDKEQLGCRKAPCPDVDPTAQTYSATSELEKNYVITVQSVQKQFSHLSEEEIFYPPHELFDAALARQIALHVMHYELSVPKRRLAVDLQRSREMLDRALKTVNRRKEKPQFEKTYKLIADDVRNTITQKKVGE